MKSLIFAKRNAKEILREPLSWLFCIGFPVVMLIIFQIINSVIPSEDVSIFRIDILLPGMMVFSFSFVMLFMAIIISKDKSTAFLMRLFSSPLKTKDYIFGYFIPGFFLGIIQMLVCITTSYIIGFSTVLGFFINIGEALLLMISCLPALILFIMTGILFGTLFNDKSAPGFSSIIISLSGMLSGAWMPIEIMKGFDTFCMFLPFYPSTLLGRSAIGTIPTTFQNTFLPLIIVLLYTMIITTLALFAFKRMMKKDK